MSRSPEKKGHVWTVIRILFGLFLIIGAWENRAEKPKEAAISIAVGLLLLFGKYLVLLVIALFKKKKSSGKSGRMDNSSEPPASVSSVRAKADKSSSAKGTAVSDKDYDADVGLYDYSYEDVELYRPTGAVGPMPPLGAHVSFEEESDNPHDSKAIRAVYNGKTVGYMNKTRLREMIRDWLTDGYYYTAEVTRADDKLEVWIGMDRE